MTVQKLAMAKIRSQISSGTFSPPVIDEIGLEAFRSVTYCFDTQIYWGQIRGEVVEETNCPETKPRPLPTSVMVLYRRSMLVGHLGTLLTICVSAQYMAGRNVADELCVRTIFCKTKCLPSFTLKHENV